MQGVERNIAVVVSCRMCKEPEKLMVDRDGWFAWYRNGGDRHIQYALPYLSVAQRELLISQTCDDCFKKLFPPEDDE